MSDAGLHPRIEAAARGELPEWAEVEPGRREHLGSVARLMEAWARDLQLPEVDRKRWTAAAWLHDALRNADPQDLRDDAPDLPAGLRHGPAAAARLRAEGVKDEELLEAIGYHTLGRPGMSRLGRYLYLADYLEPGRKVDAAGREKLRSRLPADLEGVLAAVVARRLTHQIEAGQALRRESVGFWNEIVASRE